MADFRMWLVQYNPHHLSTCVCVHVCTQHMDAYTYAYTKHRGTVTGTHTCMHTSVYTHTRMQTYSSLEPIRGPYARTCSPSPCALTSRLSWDPRRWPRLLPSLRLLSPLWQAPSRAARLLLEVRVRLCSAACWGCTSRKSAMQRADCQIAGLRKAGGLGGVLISLRDRVGPGESCCLGAAGCPSSCWSRRERTRGTSPQGSPAGQEHGPLVLPGPAMHPRASPSGEDWSGSAHCLPAPTPGCSCMQGPARGYTVPQAHQAKFSRKTSTRTVSASSIPLPPPPCGTPGPGDPSRSASRNILLRASGCRATDPRRHLIHHLTPPPSSIWQS